MRFNISIADDDLMNFKKKCDAEGVKPTDVARMLLIKFTEGNVIMKEDAVPKFWGACNSSSR